MKKIAAFLCLCMIMITLSACSQNSGKVNNAAIDLGESIKFSEDEIQQAVDCVLKKFLEFEGCDLKKIWYEEQVSNGKYGTDSVLGIVLLSDFYVDETGADNGLNPDSDYTNWKWLLIRDSETSKWKVKDWGYG